MGVDDVVAGTTALIHVGWNRVAQCGPEHRTHSTISSSLPFLSLFTGVYAGTLRRCAVTA